jgi:hypothetical protein
MHDTDRILAELEALDEAEQEADFELAPSLISRISRTSRTSSSNPKRTSRPSRAVGFEAQLNEQSSYETGGTAVGTPARSARRHCRHTTLAAMHQTAFALPALRAYSIVQRAMERIATVPGIHRPARNSRDADHTPVGAAVQVEFGRLNGRRRGESVA